MSERARRRTDNLREDCVAEALAIIGQHGLDHLSLREVARRLGVSHQAPYKHYPSRDHLLAEVVRRAFVAFAADLDARSITGDPEADLRSMGEAYVRYALAHPLQYRLMFGTTLPDPDKHPEMMGSARHAFGLLRDALRERARATGQPDDDVELDAIFIWSTLHGFASILRSDVGARLDLAQDLASDGLRHVFGRIGRAMAPD